MIDIGIITGSNVYGLPGGGERRRVVSRFGEAEVEEMNVGRWRVGGVSRHGKGHRHLPHTIPHRANVAALGELGARAVLATTVVGAVSEGLALGRPVIFDDLYFPENRLPGGEPCTVFVEPGEEGRGHLILSEPFAPRLRRKLALAAEDLGLSPITGGVYAHTNGPRFETRAEIRALKSAGVAAVSQTAGPEAVLTGELGIPYALVGFPVNHATGVGEPESEEELRRLLARAAEVLPRLVLRAVKLLDEEDFVFDSGYVYHFGSEG